MQGLPPVLLVAFNRVDTLAEVIRALAPVAPPRVYVAADGPRAGRAGERERCDAVRAMLTALPWRCEVRTRFLDANVGCALGVSGAISWFFEHEEAGVILEDDCVPDPSFLPFCAEVLARHAGDERVMSVLGTRLARADPAQRASYSFTRFFSAWGWASWRRAWSRYRLEIGDWRAALPVRGRPLPDLGGPSNLGWARKFDTVVRGRGSGGVPGGGNAAGIAPPHTWDYQWSFAHMLHGGLAVLPRTNLVSNIGEGPDATHIGRGSVWLNLPRTAVELPLVPPERVESDAAADLHRERWHLNHRPWLARKYWQIRNRHAIGGVDARRGW